MFSSRGSPPADPSAAWRILPPLGRGRHSEEQGLNLDFTTPPKRPDRKLPPLFQE